jgi:hypothetical protein
MQSSAFPLRADRADYDPHDQHPQPRHDDRRHELDLRAVRQADDPPDAHPHRQQDRQRRDGESLWLGATGANAAGTEFLWQAYSVPANSYVDAYCRVPLSTADFLVGGSGTATALSIEGEGEIYIVA